MARRRAARGRPRPAVPAAIDVPGNSVPAMRVAVLGCESAWGPAFARAALRANHGEARDIAAAEVIDELLAELGLNVEAKDPARA